MKHIAFISILLSTLCFGCGKDDGKVEDPLPDLPWLKEIVNGFEGDKLTHARISQCTYKEGTGFLLELCVGCPDFGSILTNSNGEILCILYGHAGDPCTEFEIDFDSVKVIWEINNKKSRK